MTKLKNLVAMTFCLMVALPAWASTTNQRLLILDAESKGSKWMLSVCALWGSKQPKDASGRLKVEGRVHAFLDGKKVKPEEAFKPGHTFRHQGDSGYFECYSSDFHFPDAKTSGQHDGAYVLTLKNAAKARAPSKAKGSRGQMRDFRYDLYLHLEVRDGAIAAVGATGLYQKNNSIASLPVDATGLKLEGNRLQGPVVVTYLSHRDRKPAEGVDQLPRTHTIDVTLGKNESSGSYSTEGEGAEGAVSGRKEAVPERSADCTIWIGGPGSVSLRMKDGALVDGLYSVMKGYASGIVKASTLKIDGNRIEGEVTCLVHGEERKMRISGVLVGHHIFGEYEKDDSVGRIRGGIRIFDCPPFMCWSEGEIKGWVRSNPGELVPSEFVLPKDCRPKTDRDDDARKSRGRSRKSKRLPGIDALDLDY